MQAENTSDRFFLTGFLNSYGNKAEFNLIITSKQQILSD